MFSLGSAFTVEMLKDSKDFKRKKKQKTDENDSHRNHCLLNTTFKVEIINI